MIPGGGVNRLFEHHALSFQLHFPCLQSGREGKGEEEKITLPTKQKKQWETWFEKSKKPTPKKESEKKGERTLTSVAAQAPNGISIGSFMLVGIRTWEIENPEHSWEEVALGIDILSVSGRWRGSEGGMECDLLCALAFNLELLLSRDEFGYLGEASRMVTGEQKEAKGGKVEQQNVLERWRIEIYLWLVVGEARRHLDNNGVFQFPEPMQGETNNKWINESGYSRIKNPIEIAWSHACVIFLASRISQTRFWTVNLMRLCWQSRIVICVNPELLGMIVYCSKQVTWCRSDQCRWMFENSEGRSPWWHRTSNAVHFSLRSRDDTSRSVYHNSN